MSVAKVWMTSIALVALIGGTAQGAFVSDGPAAAVDFDLGTDADVTSDHVYNFCPTGSPHCVNGNFLITGTRVVFNPWNPAVTMTLKLTVLPVGAQPPLGPGFTDILCSYAGLASDVGFSGYSSSAINYACALPAAILYSAPAIGTGGYYSFKYSAKSSGNGEEGDTGSGYYFLEGDYSSESSTSGVPEPASVFLVAGAFAGFALLRRGRMVA